LELLKDLTVLIAEKKAAALANIQAIENEKEGKEEVPETTETVSADPLITPKKVIENKKRGVTDKVKMKRLCTEQEVDRKALVAIEAFLKEMSELQTMWDVDSERAATETSETITLLVDQVPPLSLEQQSVSTDQAPAPPPPMILSAPSLRRPVMVDEGGVASLAETASQASAENAPLLGRPHPQPPAEKQGRSFLEMFGFKRKVTTAAAAPVILFQPSNSRRDKDQLHL
jgi:hypothetical protein